LLSELNKKHPGRTPCFKSSHALSFLYITKGDAEQPAELKHHTILIVSLFALQLDQICDVTFLHIALPVILQNAVTAV